MYEYYVGLENGYEPEEAAREGKNLVKVVEYDEKVLPRFLSNPDWYLLRHEFRIPNDVIWQESDSEKKVQFNRQEVEAQNAKAMATQLENLKEYMDCVNETLKAVKNQLEGSMEKSIVYVHELASQFENKQVEKITVEQPSLPNLNSLLYQLYDDLE